jgi:hypothetical protein
MAEPTVIADSAEQAPSAVTAPTPATVARINEHLSSFIDSGDLPGFTPSTSNDPVFVLNAGIEAPAYQGSEGWLPPISAFDADSDAPQFQLARAAGIDLFNRGSGGFGGGFGAGPGSGGGVSGAVSDVGAGASYSSSDSPTVSTDSANDLSAYEGRGPADDNRERYRDTPDRHDSDRRDDHRGRSDHNGPFDNGRSEPGGSTRGNIDVPRKPGDTPGAFPGGTVGGGNGGSVPSTSVPEPSSLLLTGAGLVGLANAMRRRMAR